MAVYSSRCTCTLTRSLLPLQPGSPSDSGGHLPPLLTFRLLLYGADTSHMPCRVRVHLLDWYNVKSTMIEVNCSIEIFMETRIILIFHSKKLMRGNMETRTRVKYRVCPSWDLAAARRQRPMRRNVRVLCAGHLKTAPNVRGTIHIDQW